MEHLSANFANTFVSHLVYCSSFFFRVMPKRDRRNEWWFKSICALNRFILWWDKNCVPFSWPQLTWWVFDWYIQIVLHVNHLPKREALLTTTLIQDLETSFTVEYTNMWMLKIQASGTKNLMKISQMDN